MKPLFTLTICACLLIACRKAELPANDYLGQVKTALRDSVSAEDFSTLDFSRAVLNSVDSVHLYLLRIPFKNLGANHFVLLKTSKEGSILQGRIVTLDGEAKEKERTRVFEGRIIIQSLQRKTLIESPITDGFITAFHSNMQSRSSLVQPGNVLPEVIITYVIPSGGDVSWSSWIWLQSFFGESYSQPYYSFFNSDSGSSPWTGGGGGGNASGGSALSSVVPTNEPLILVDFESDFEKEQIDLQKFVNCFSAVPDAGATCSIEISTDIPVDANPNAFYNFSTGSPGHAFITIKKSNGSQRVTQNIGFYPKSNYKSVTYAPTAGKLVDNGGHEFNASLKMNLTPAQLSTVLIRMQQLSNLNYDVDEYNCTDWALDIFNSVRTAKLEIPLYGLPGSPLTQHSRTPQGLYHKLQQMVTSNDSEKGNVTIGIYKGYAGSSAGPCN